MTKIRFIVNGLGLGNSTRCHAIIQRLNSMDVETSVATSGNGLWYFKNKSEITRLDELKAIHYGAKEGQISIIKTFAAVPTILGVLRDNMRLMMELLQVEKPDAVVIDSDYSFLPMRRLGIPIIALNNSDIVVQSKRRFAPMPDTVRGQYYAVERFDFLFHRVIPDLVISPSLESNFPSYHKKFKRVASVVREQYRPTDWRTHPKKVVIMLSGSMFGSPVVLKQDSYPFHIDIIGRDTPDGWHDCDGIKFHSRIRDNAALLTEADLTIVNGGFSAISEVFHMRKPIIVIPVPKHAEQWVNAKTIERIGVGMVSQESNLEPAMLAAFGRIDELRNAYQQLGRNPDGAKQAAEKILKFLRNNR